MSPKKGSSSEKQQQCQKLKNSSSSGKWHLKILSLHREMAASSYLLPPLEQHVLLPREASQGTLGYKNHPTYDYLTCTQARSWSYRHVRLSWGLYGWRSRTVCMSL